MILEAADGRERRSTADERRATSASVRPKDPACRIDVTWYSSVCAAQTSTLATPVTVVSTGRNVIEGEVAQVHQRAVSRSGCSR